LFFIFGPFGHHVAEFRDRLGSLAAEISKDIAVKEAFVVAVNDVVFGDVGNSGALLEEMLCIVSQGLFFVLFALG